MTLEVISLSHSLTVREQSVLEVAQKCTAALEARQVGLAHQHHLNQDDDLLRVGLKSLKATGHSVPEVAERLGVFSAHHIKHLFGQFERRGLELETLARCV